MRLSKVVHEDEHDLVVLLAPFPPQGQRAFSRTYRCGVFLARAMYGEEPVQHVSRRNNIVARIRSLQRLSVKNDRGVDVSGYFHQSCGVEQDSTPEVIIQRQMLAALCTSVKGHVSRFRLSALLMEGDRDLICRRDSTMQLVHWEMSLRSCSRAQNLSELQSPRSGETDIRRSGNAGVMCRQVLDSNPLLQGIRFKPPQLTRHRGSLAELARARRLAGRAQRAPDVITCVATGSYSRTLVKSGKLVLGASQPEMPLVELQAVATTSRS
ncbi:MAG: hypothetical protein V4550_10600 [Gemmatimonadota bacterium]